MTDPLAVLLRDAWASWIEDPNRPDDFEGYAAARLFAAGVRVTAPPSDAAAPLDVERLADAIFTARISCRDDEEWRFIDDGDAAGRIAREYAALAPSEYGRLLAERDRLIASGVDPADLDIPDAPTVDTP